MIQSIGVDLVQVARVQQALQRHGQRFLKRVFTEREIGYCLQRRRQYASLAARFAAKEAVFKALGLGWGGGLRWRDVEIVSNSQRKPKVVLHGKAGEMVGQREVLISL
jgi:holo-[acyl-carrier protein] synthase